MLFTVSLLFMGANLAWGQRTVTGKVTSADEPMGIPSVAVMVEGTTIGVTTDMNGMFTLKNVPTTAKNLKISAMGLKTKTLPISNAPMNIVMESSAIALQEVSITGYGVRKKVDNVGAASQVGEEVIKKQTESNIINSLQGSTAGLQISSSTGQPGSPTTARIRGNSSINSGNEPLYVIDGVPVSNGEYGMYTATDPLATINPEDIENIAILKDASATSIYGSRASNGVIVVTTKKGTEGKATFTLNGKIGFSTPPSIKHDFQKVNRDNYKNFLYDSYLNSLKDGYVPTALYEAAVKDPSSVWKKFEAVGVYFNRDINTNWWDEVTRTGLIQDYSITASGGTDKVNYFASVGYFSNQGIVIGTDFKRYSARLNLDYKPTKWLAFGMNLSGAYAEINSVPTELAYASPIWSASMMRPTDPVRNPDGSWYTNYNQGYNPVALYQDEYRDIAFQQQYKALFSPYLRVRFYKNVYFQTKIGLDFVTVKERNTWSSKVNPQGTSLGGLTQNQDQTAAVLNVTNTLNWMPSIKKNNFNVLIGQEAQRFNDYVSYISGFGYSTPKLMDIANAAETKGSAYRANATLASYFGNIEYDYDNKYYLSASIRRDGSSRFGEDSKWGTFYAVGAKYRLSAERFMASANKWLNNLTIRLSYGTSGNQNVNYYAAQGLYSTTRYGGLNGLIPSSLDNPDLRWESRNKFDVGVEFSVLNALTIEVDYYNDITEDMIFAIPLSASTGFTGLTSNVGRMRNQGVEIQINALLMNRKNFKWTLALNFTTNNNKVLKLATDKPIIGSITKLEVGKSSSSFYMQEYAGVDPATGHPRWYGKDGEYVYSYNQANKRDFGSYSPLFYGGISTRFDFYNFDLSLQFNYNYGNKLFVNDLRYLETIGESYTQAPTNYVVDHAWRNPGDETDVPQLRYAGNNGAENWSSRQVVDASYFKIKSIMLGYTLPKKLAKKIYMASFRAYVSIDNVYTATNKNFRGYDPEAGLGGTQAANYPIPVNYTLGVNIGF